MRHGCICLRSVKEKEPEEICKICSEIKKELLTLLKIYKPLYKKYDKTFTYLSVIGKFNKTAKTDRKTTKDNLNNL